MHTSSSAFIQVYKRGRGVLVQPQQQRHNARHTTSSCCWQEPTLQRSLHGQYTKAEGYKASRARTPNQGQSSSSHQFQGQTVEACAVSASIGLKASLMVIVNLKSVLEGLMSCRVQTGYKF
jgi:hypothetical protein